MRFTLSIASIIVIVIFSLIGCNKKENTTEISTNESATVRKSLDNIISPDTIDIQRAFFEKTYGPAKRILGDITEYEIGKCLIKIEYDKNNSITSVELANISKECNFNGKNIYLNSMADQINYAEIISVAMDWNAKLSCYTMCGNAADPDYGAYIETARVYGSIEFDATTDYSSSEKASDNVEKYFKMKYPSVDLIGGDIGSIPKDEYNKIWFENFKDVKLTSIKFGYNLKK
jgi:hypothetical protein